MELTRERISFTFDPRDMLLSLQMGFRTSVACAILERTSGLEPSFETTAPKYMKLVTVPSIALWCPAKLILKQCSFKVVVVGWCDGGLKGSLDPKQPTNQPTSFKVAENYVFHVLYCLQIALVLSI